MPPLTAKTVFFTSFKHCKGFLKSCPPFKYKGGKKTVHDKYVPAYFLKQGTWRARCRGAPRATAGTCGDTRDAPRAPDPKTSRSHSHGHKRCVTIACGMHPMPCIYPKATGDQKTQWCPLHLRLFEREP